MYKGEEWKRRGREDPEQSSEGSVTREGKECNDVLANAQYRGSQKVEDKGKDSTVHLPVHRYTLYPPWSLILQSSAPDLPDLFSSILLP